MRYIETASILITMTIINHLIRLTLVSQCHVTTSIPDITTTISIIITITLAYITAGTSNLDITSITITITINTTSYGTFQTMEVSYLHVQNNYIPMLPQTVQLFVQLTASIQNKTATTIVTITNTITTINNNTTVRTPKLSPPLHHQPSSKP